MPKGPRVLMDHACYHIMARGNQKQVIFKERQDYKEYLERLRVYKKRHSFRLYCFCLMPNHIHLLGEIGEKKNLSCFMHDLTRSYTAYFNNKYGKVGYLWQGRFLSKIIIKDRYFVDCLNYIELNPIRSGIVATPGEYPWSSYRERNFGCSAEEKILSDLTLHEEGQVPDWKKGRFPIEMVDVSKSFLL